MSSGSWLRLLDYSLTNVGTDHVTDERAYVEPDTRTDGVSYGPALVRPGQSLLLTLPGSVLGADTKPGEGTPAFVAPIRFAG